MGGHHPTHSGCETNRAVYGRNGVEGVTGALGAGRDGESLSHAKMNTVSP